MSQKYNIHKQKCWFQLVLFTHRASKSSLQATKAPKEMIIFALIMKFDKPEYNEIRRMVEETLGRKIETPKDFELLAQQIFIRTNVLLSVSTLKRFWGYVAKQDETRGEMRKSTLNTFANYVGYTDWDAFCQEGIAAAEADASSLFYGQKYLDVNSLYPGDTLLIIWKPNRKVTVRYSGNYVFVVIANENSKLSVGDTFKCHLFVEHQPLVVVDLLHNGLPPCGYTCGKKDGILFQKLE